MNFLLSRFKSGSTNWKQKLFNLIENNEIDEARRIFANIPSPSIHLYTMMIAGYSQCNRIRDAYQLFDLMPERDLVAWNSMIKACFDCGDVELGFKLFGEMPQRSVVSWTNMINGLGQMGRIDAAEELFLQMPERDIVAWNAMVSSYCNNGRLQKAFSLFKKMPVRNVISWTAMIGGYEQNGESDKALSLFAEMLVTGIRPTATTFACALTACANVSEAGFGAQLHGYVAKFGFLLDTFVSTSLVNMYANCKQIEKSSKLFDECCERNVVSWTALLTGYNLNGKYEDALDEFKKMVVFGIRPNQSTFTSALHSCCDLEALDRGLKIHASIVKVGLEFDVFVANSLIDMYSKCGDIEDSLKHFDSMNQRNLVSWNSIIIGCAQNGCTSQALRLFDAMKVSSIQPDEVTYIGLLNACSRARMLDMGRHIFHLLRLDASVEIKLEHYASMVDVLGRCGHVEEAQNFIENMPVEPNVMIWMVLLSACRVHMNIKIARRTYEKISHVDPSNSAAYILMSNIYATAGFWNDVSQIRMTMRSQGITKTPGYCWVTLKEERHEFVCGDRSHPMALEIYKKMDWLRNKLKELGYTFDKRFALHDLDDEQKEDALTYHSEKIAVAFGLLATANGSTIRIMKNLRVCDDCHSYIKLVSKVVGRHIVLRDASRFHHFRDGSCSCTDRW